MTKFCPECGFKQKDDKNRYCSNCGFDFSILEDDRDSISSEDSSVNVPISSDSNGSSSGSVGSDSNNSSNSENQVSPSPNNKTKAVSNPTSKSKIVSNSTNRTKTVSNSTIKAKKVTNSNGFLSNLSFNKCFLAFAVLLIVMVIGGMLVQTTQEPYSDDGLTSFMESSDHYDLSSFLDDNGSDNDDSYDFLDDSGSDNDDSYDYLSYNN